MIRPHEIPFPVRCRDGMWRYDHHTVLSNYVYEDDQCYQSFTHIGCELELMGSTRWDEIDFKSHVGNEVTYLLMRGI